MPSPGLSLQPFPKGDGVYQGCLTRFSACAYSLTVHFKNHDTQVLLLLVRLYGGFSLRRSDRANLECV